MFELPDEARVTKLTDATPLDVTTTGCEARLVRTQYEGPDGARGEGGVDANDKRAPPAPFGPVPDITESGFVLAAFSPTPTPTPPPAKDVTAPPTATEHRVAEKTGGCSIHSPSERASLVLLPLLRLARRRRR